MLKLFKHYKTGMAIYDRCHPPTLRSQWSAFSAELTEFITEPSFAEAWDIFHAGGRLIWLLTGVPLQYFAYPTVKKHSQRFTQTGCIRSQRNCQGRCRLSS